MKNNFGIFILFAILIGSVYFYIASIFSYGKKGISLSSINPLFVPNITHEILCPTHAPIVFDSLKSRGGNVYIDLGANDGQRLDIYFQDLHTELQAPLGQEWEIYLFEMNSVFINTLNQKLSGWGPVQGCVVNSAVWTKTGPLKFLQDLRSVKTPNQRMTVYNATASSIFDVHLDIQKYKFRHKGRSHKWVDACSIDFSEWLQVNLDVSQEVFLKVDIEGAEYTLIPHMLETGSLGKYINTIAIEWHPKIFAQNFVNGSYNEQIHTNHVKEIQEMIENLGVKFANWEY